MDRQILNAADAGDGDVELRMLRDRVIASPEKLEARIELGQAYEKRGYPELALDHYRWAVEHSPESAEAQLLLAKALDGNGHSEEAIAMLSAFLTAHPQKTPELYSWLGIMRDDAGDWKGSEQAYRDALAKASEDRDYLHNNLGYSLLKQGQNEKAAEQFRAALKLNPSSEIARDNLGISLASEPKEAVLNWQSMNEPATAHSNLAAILIEQKKYPEARKELEIALKYNRTNAAALANLELLSGLDGKHAVLPVAAERKTAWARVKATWQHWFGGEKPASQEQIQAQTTSESKP